MHEHHSTYTFPTALLATNRQIYKEANPIFYNENRFIHFDTNIEILRSMLAEEEIVKVGRTGTALSTKMTFGISLQWKPQEDSKKWTYVIAHKDLAQFILILCQCNLICEKTLFPKACLLLSVPKKAESASSARIQTLLRPLVLLKDISRVNITGTVDPEFGRWLTRAITSWATVYDLRYHVEQQDHRAKISYDRGKVGDAIHHWMEAVSLVSGALRHRPAIKHTERIDDEDVSQWALHVSCSLYLKVSQTYAKTASWHAARYTIDEAFHELGYISLVNSPSHIVTELLCLSGRLSEFIMPLQTDLLMQAHRDYRATLQTDPHNETAKRGLERVQAALRELR